MNIAGFTDAAKTYTGLLIQLPLEPILSISVTAVEGHGEQDCDPA